MHAKIKVQAPNTMGTIWIVKATQNTSVAPYQVKKVYTKKDTLLNVDLHMKPWER